MVTLIRERTVTARRPHRCSTCGAVYVQPGQRYQRSTYVYDRHVYDWLTCPDCDAIAVDVWDWSGSDGDEGIGQDDYQVWAEENIVDPRAVAYLRRSGWTDEQIAECLPDGAA